MTDFIHIPSLANLCMKTIAQHIDRYPPSCFCVLSEKEFELVIQFKSTLNTPKDVTTLSTGNHTRLSNGRKQPLLSPHLIQEIEECNPHLADSTFTDDMIWKDCVEYKFKRGGISRPTIFIMPWPKLVQKMRDIGTNLSQLFQEQHTEKRFETSSSASSSIDEQNEFMMQIRMLNKSITILENAPMCIPLLLESEIGKTLKKLVRKCQKFNDGKYGAVGQENVRIRFQLPRYPNQFVDIDYLIRLENMLKAWMEIGEQNDAKSTTDITEKDYSGRNHKTTSMKQHLQDIETTSKSCFQWRSLFKALDDREKNFIKNHGARMRQIRDEIAEVRPKIGQVNTKKRGPSCLSVKNSNESGSVKMKKLRDEAFASNKQLKGNSNSKGLIFGSAVASAKGQNCKKNGKSRGVNNSFGSYCTKNTKTVVMDGGKKLIMPDSKSIKKINRL